MSTAANRPRNPRGEGTRLREQLLQATTEVLNEIGDADRVSVRAIARRAGVSPTALYLHFPDRDALVTAAVDAGFEAFNAELTTAAAAAGSPRERLLAMGHAYIAFSERRPALYAILFSARRPLLDERSRTDRERAIEGLVALLQLHDPSLARSGATELALIIWSSLHGYALLRSTRPHFEWPPPEVFLRRVLDAYAPG